MSDFPSQTQDKFVLRLPDGMRDRIKSSAEENGRSMNAEIVSTLMEKYPAPQRSEDEQQLTELFLSLPEEVQRAFINKHIADRIADGRITERDIADGLVPGVILKKDAN